MSGTQNQSPPKTFIKQVKDALEHLYDFPYLQCHPLAQVGQVEGVQPGETPGQWLRRELMAAIETLNPGANTPFRSPRARIYNLLLLRYVEGMMVQEAANELGISRRQAHRDLKQGQESVATIFWSRRPVAVSKGYHATELSSIETEMARLTPHPHSIDLSTLLQQTQEAVEQMTAQRKVTLNIEIPLEPTTISVDPLIARQVLISTLSYAIGQSQPGGRLGVRLISNSDEQISLSLHYLPDAKTSRISTTDQVVKQLAAQLGWTVRQENQADGSRTFTLHSITPAPTILIIDDNEGLVTLLKDYLTDHACKVITATDSQKGLQLAQEYLPDTIIMDVMMPEMDGWELLQRLRAHPQTGNIPIIVCSVINNPELAYALQASLFITKPVSRADILNALRQLGVV